MMSPTEKSAVLKSLNVKGHYKPVDEKVVTRCHKITRLIQEEDLDENESSDVLDEMMTSCSNQEEKVATSGKISWVAVNAVISKESPKKRQLNAGPSSAASSSFSNPQKRVKRSSSATGSSSAVPRGTPSSASTSTKSSNTLNPAERTLILSRHDSVPEDKKWKMENDIKHISELYLRNSRQVRLQLRAAAASAVGRNNSRSLSLKEKRPRKAMGAKVDTLFKYGQVEIGCSEVGKNDVSVVDDKYLDDGLVKLPKTLRDMLCLQVRKNTGQINHLRTFGLLMMGMDLQVLMLNIPVGSSIVRVTRSTAFSFPNSLADISSDLPSLLEITYKVKQALLENIRILNNKKQKAAVLYNSNGQDDELPFSFF